uniref:Uncharacterized protein n=1 Tax=Anguilla anguilla TaxID=7936 RepID=A0A0E9X6N9_ANGAN
MSLSASTMQRHSGVKHLVTSVHCLECPLTAVTIGLWMGHDPEPTPLQSPLSFKKSDL